MSSLLMLIISVPYLNEIYFDFETSFKRVFFISLLSTIKPNGPSLEIFIIKIYIMRTQSF